MTFDSTNYQAPGLVNTSDATTTLDMTTDQQEPSRYEYLGIRIHRRNPSYANDLSKGLLYEGDYVREGESIPQALARPATNFCFGDYELAQRIYDYAHKGWFMYASPVLSNATPGNWYPDPTKDGDHYWHRQTFIPKAKPQGQPISCFAFEVPDNLEGQEETIRELARLSTSGGGTGAHNSVRATSKKAPGPIPYEKVLDSAIGYFKQKGTRKGALAFYMGSKHPSIREHILFRVPGGDAKRRSDNRTQFHTAVNLTNELIDKILGRDPNLDYELRCPHTNELYETVNARHLWEEMIETRALSGEPFMLKIDRANELLPETQKNLGLKINGSNLCLAGDTKITVVAPGEEAPKDVDLQSVIGKTGYKVLSYNTRTKQSEFKAVTNSALMSKKAKVMRITDTETGKQLMCTPDHQVWTENRGYVMAKDLKADDVLRIL
jgi:ribonucleotide reductase alpha subunit